MRVRPRNTSVSLTLTLMSIAALVLPGARAATEPLRVTGRAFANGAVIDVVNSIAVPMTVSITWSGTNFRPNQKSPLQIVVPGNRTVRAVTLTQINRQARFEYKFNFRYRQGDLNARHDPETIYQLPFKGTFSLSQGFNGRFSHTGDNQYSVDFPMPEGTEVLAARDGVVAFVETKFSEGGKKPSLMNRANIILIGHADGTVGKYLHLQQNGARVKVGQPVKAGDVIGLSGNTGYTTEPHLHFELIRPKSAAKFASLPFKFRDGAPQEGREYTNE